MLDKMKSILVFRSQPHTVPEKRLQARGGTW